MNIEKVRAKRTEAFMQLPNVVGVGMGEKHGHAVIKVLVTRKLPPADLPLPGLIPARVEGYETDVELIGVPTVQ